MTSGRFQAPRFPSRTDPLRRWRHLDPERIALVDRVGDRRLSYAELDERAETWKRRLRALGVEPGDRIATLARERRELVHLFFACGRLGAALVPLNWRLPPTELAGILALARPTVLLTGDGYRGSAEEAVGRARSIEPPTAATGTDGTDGSAPVWLDLDRPDDAPSGEPGPDAEVEPDTPHLILFTSGTTGRPKGVILPHRQILYNAVATTTAWELGPGDVAPISTPLFHTGGWNVFATPLWHRGGRVVLMEGFDADRFLGALAGEGCTVALVIPTQLRMIREGEEWGRPLPELKSLFSGGAPLAPELAASTRDAGYPIREGYGLTECGPNCFAISPEEAKRAPGSVGRPASSLETRLDAVDGGRPEPGEPGELLLRGPQMFGGYFREPERTAWATTPVGCLGTGDLARRDDEGRFYICGRRKEMFISGGENVFPAEVESVLSGCPGVADVAVIGVPHPRWGEVGRAFVVPEDGAELSLDDLRAWAADRLARYKVPKSLVTLDQMPRLASGKPDRKALADRHGDEVPEAPARRSSPAASGGNSDREEAE
jgi:fatty-acyl-CoA synthase